MGRQIRSIVSPVSLILFLSTAAVGEDFMSDTLLKGDFNHDGVVDREDLSTFLQISASNGVAVWGRDLDNDGTGEITTHPGVIMDLDNDGILGVQELNTYVREYLRNADGTDVPFWTEVVANRPGCHESVEIFDWPSSINQDGEATDNTVVLLRRPETPQEGFGFDGDAILFEVTFRALAIGDASIEIDGAKGILEDFVDVETDVKEIQTVLSPSIVTIE